MSYILKGTLSGLLCNESEEMEPLSNVKVRLYRLRDDQQETALAAANPKDTMQILTQKMVTDKATYLIAETETNENGGYVFHLNEEQKYNGGPFEVDVYLETVPKRKPTKRKYSPVQFTITTLQPMWRESETGMIAAWDYAIPSRNWCFIRARFGAWVILGKVTVCGTNNPVWGVRVHAFDTDWIQDDALGSGLTDANGIFRIDYAEEDFKKTPFSPTINWEMVSGPDLYFRVESTAGTPLLTEPRSRGRDAGRENAGPCFCVKLCLSEDQVTVDPGHTHPLFTHVGSYKITTDFTADGLTASGNYAFTRDIPLVGILPNGDDPVQMEYRFLYGKYSSGGILGPLSPVDATMIPPTKIGQLEYWHWTGSSWVIMAEDYWVNNPGATYNVTVGPGGWIKVPTESSMGSLPAAGASKFVAGGPISSLIRLDTTKLVNEYFDLISPTVHLAGNSLAAPQKSEIHTFHLKFEARPIGLPVSNTNTLNKIVISNTHYTFRRHPGWHGHDVTDCPAVLMLDIDEMVKSGGGCNTMGNDLHALYTAYHPHAGNVIVYFTGNSPLPPSYSPPLSGGEAVSPPGGYHFDISALAPCAYILWIRIDLNLTSGWGLISYPYSQYWDYIAFCK
jgi:5-hydroxyisourate hydrolase-like protein (transthyretin family)